MPEALATKLPALRQLGEVPSHDLFVSEVLKHVRSLVQQAELLARQYDAVVANPPYMGSKFHIPVLKKFLKDHYKGYEKDVFSAFIDRDLAFSKPRGRLGFMSPFVWMFISSHEHLRTRLIDKETITSLVQLEYSGFEGATVPICTFTLQKGRVDAQKGCFIRLSDFRGSDSQAPKTLEAVHNRECGWFFEAAQDGFKNIPGSPVAYWVSESMRATFTSFPRLDTCASPRKGMVTADNPRFIRCWHEVSASNTGRGFSKDCAADSKNKWFPYTKGGSFRRWAGNYEHVVNWGNAGYELLHMQEEGYKVGSTNHNLDFIFRPALTWTKITSNDSGFRVTPAGFLFDDASGVCPVIVDGAEPLVLALLNSPVTMHILRALNPTLNLNPGNLCTIPLDSRQRDKVAIDKCVEIAKTDWNAYERSWDFKSLPILTASTEPTPTLELSYTTWVTQNRNTIIEMKRLEEENNRLFIDAYGLADELTPDVPIEQITLTVNPAYRYGRTLTDEEQWTRFREDTMAELISYAIGCMMGRYSLDEPGLIYAHSGNVDFDPNRYITFPADDDGIVPLTDTEWFDDDAVHRLIEFISVTWHARHLEDNLTFLADSLRPKSNESSRDTIRRYLCDSFFTNHLQTYKKRPIYWLFSSGKQKAFQCLVYLHRYHESTLARTRPNTSSRSKDRSRPASTT